MFMAGLVMLGGDTLAAVPVNVAPPVPPGLYSVPASAVRVRNGTELARELAEESPRDILLADGVYGSDRPFTNACGHRLYAEHPGQSVLTVGLSIGGDTCSSGGRVQGLVFDINNAAKTPGGAAIEIWGNARFTVVADTTIRGHSVLEAGIVARQPEGLQITRVVATDFRSYGILVDADVFDLAVVVPPLLLDLDVANVSRPRPGEADGTAEACIWVGNTAIGERFRVRNCAWMGVWTGTAVKNAHFSDIDIDDIPLSAGLYLEHFTTDTTFDRLSIGRNVSIGVACEWADPSWGSRPACDGVIIQDSVIRARCVGAYLDDGTRN
ncbi:MAG TPA: hypothetical protein VES39_07140, partial [Rhodospirillales bacterium]|nr:hypothetical protein [Rhodospirillales bacterium]